MAPFPAKKKPMGIATTSTGKPPMPTADDLESPDPVEGKAMPDPAEESAESPDDASAEEYGAKLVKDIESAGTALGMDAATSRKAAGAFFKAAADCLGGGEGEDSGLDAGSPGDMPADDIAY